MTICVSAFMSLGSKVGPEGSYDRQRKPRYIHVKQGSDRAPVPIHAALNGEARDARDEASKHDGVDDEACLTWQYA